VRWQEGRGNDGGGRGAGSAAADQQRALMDAAAEELAQLKVALARAQAEPGRLPAEEAEELDRLRHDVGRIVEQAAVAAAAEQVLLLLLLLRGWWGGDHQDVPAAWGKRMLLGARWNEAGPLLGARCGKHAGRLLAALHGWLGN
jgi:hypothetical protein